MSTSELDRSALGYRLDVQGLRAVAVGLVVLYHFNFLGCTGGYVGVDVFFVISGFVIAGVIFRETARTGRVSLFGFYARRARRILPASTVTVIVTLAVSIVLFGRLGTLSIAHDAIAAALFSANFHFSAQGTDYFAASLPPSPLLHFWSLAVEEQFYFVIPTFVLVVAMFRRRVRHDVVVVVGVLVALSFLYSVIETSIDHKAAYYSIATRAWELGVGVLAAGVVHRCRHLRPRVAHVGAWIGFAMILLSAWTYSPLTAYPGAAAVLPVLGAALVILCGATTTRRSVGVLLTLPFFVWVGDLSYSLYLWHFPVKVLADRYWSAPQGMLSRIVLLGVVIALSYASFRFVESPMRSATRLRRSPGRSLVVGATLVASAVAVALIPILSVPQGGALIVTGHPALVRLQQEIVAGTHLTTLPSATDPALSPTLPSSDFSLPGLLATCNPVETATTVGTCFFGDLHARPLVVLYGNSQAQMWAPTLDELGQSHHFRLLVVAKSACGTFEQVGYVDPTGRVSTICEQFVHWAVQRINALHPRTLVIASTLGNLLRPGANPSQLGPDGRLPGSSLVLPTPLQASRALEGLVHDFAPSGAHIVVIGNIAVPQVTGRYPGNTTPNGCLLANAQRIQICALPTPTLRTSRNRRALETAAHAAGVAFINVDPLLCAHGICPPIVHKILVHFDTLHLSAAYARYISQGFGVLLGRALP